MLGRVKRLTIEARRAVQKSAARCHGRINGWRIHIFCCACLVSVGEAHSQSPAPHDQPCISQYPLAVYICPSHRPCRKFIHNESESASPREIEASDRPGERSPLRKAEPHLQSEPAQFPTLLSVWFCLVPPSLSPHA
ncbi:hypothetical protein BT67DRAFT_101946 [Trichocladium antarcticum]|uniref:Uncharacterized protein n=1 Tax=Trichocladium antarcticum TaxID=1450529 RepID=A0AAN6ZFK1_9PEZI|nr:hypothetical protein BT67DRAFT_101946 [Trichocladium antarcticum]